MQQEYQRRMERQGAILRAIFVERAATETTRVVDYLLWLDWQWSVYNQVQQDPEFVDEGFVRFVQSGLGDQHTELRETWRFA